MQPKRRRRKTLKMVRKASRMNQAVTRRSLKRRKIKKTKNPRSKSNKIDLEVTLLKFDYRKEEGETSEQEEEEGEVKEPNWMIQVSNIKPEEIPEVPSNKFLMRGAPDKEKNNKDRKRGKNCFS